ncbi:MAG: hypothetical protein AB7G21_15215 [Dehalococcoidia bacterium]
MPLPATDWLLVRAWVEPDHPLSLRVAIRGRDGARAALTPAATFLEPADAAAYVDRWLTAFARHAGRSGPSLDSAERGASE